jgi:hypothetical protein
MAQHIQHVMNIGGEQHVGIGSDWGVASSPEPVMNRLRAEARNRGFREEHGFDFASITDGFEQWSADFPPGSRVFLTCRAMLPALPPAAPRCACPAGVPVP